MPYGNKFLRKILIEIAWTASRTRNCFFSNFSYVQCTVKRKTKMKVQVAIARKILVAVGDFVALDFTVALVVARSESAPAHKVCGFMEMAHISSGLRNYSCSCAFPDTGDGL